MKAFCVEVVRDRRMQEMVVVAESAEDAKARALKRRSDWHVRECVELSAGSYFTVSDWDLDEDGERVAQNLPMSVRIRE